MDKITKVTRREKIDFKDTQITNKITGEIIDLSNDNLYRTIDTDQIEYHYDSYVYTNTERVQSLLESEISLGDLGLLMAISVKLLPVQNICMMDDKTPHTTKSISECIHYSVDRTKTKLDNLIELGVLAYEKINWNKGSKKVYIVNPFYVRRGKIFTNYIPTLFYRSAKEGKVMSEIKTSLEESLNKQSNSTDTD